MCVCVLAAFLARPRGAVDNSSYQNPNLEWTLKPGVTLIVYWVSGP